eukprot:GEMP01072546.1.p1 GENE.GEMP01072546.1~~GEMP01072546.1.p1  ORF type:complete len:119 (+),score=34.91 GEMP01072546.1:52-408(+)
MAAQIEGKAAKQSFVQRSVACVGSMLRPGAVPYSLLYGAAVGVGLSALVYAGRTAHIVLFDYDYYKLQSRRRYLEKQDIFFQEQDETLKAHRTAALVQEYDPAALRMPFQALDPKYRF